MNKQSRTFYSLLSLSYVGLSVSGLVLLSLLTFNFHRSYLTFKFQNQLVNSIFAVICVLGVIAGIFPSKCLQILPSKGKHKTSDKIEQIVKGGVPPRFLGHHPTCGNFSTHVFRLRGKVYCAGCTGLITGAVISLFGVFVYPFIEVSIVTDVFVFWVGFSAVICGLLQHYALDGKRNVTINFFLNVILVLGSFFLLIGVSEITNNLILEFYLFILMIYWIFTRIQTSQIQHRQICTTCALKSCGYVQARD